MDFSAVLTQDILIAGGFILSFGLGVISGLLS